jgi:RNA polymerase sigma factor (sigma-70 family)
VLHAACAGAGWALERLYSGLAPAVAGYVRLRGALDPEGLTNEVFIGVLRNLAEFEGDGEALHRWIFTIAHRRVIDERRRRAVRPATAPLTPRVDLPGGDVEQEALASLGNSSVVRLLDDLTDHQREVLLLRFVADLPVDEVAAVLGRTPGSVKQLQRRALDRLRQRLPVHP